MSRYESYNESIMMSQVRKESRRMSQMVQQTGEADTLRQVMSCNRDKIERKRVGLDHDK